MPPPRPEFTIDGPPEAMAAYYRTQNDPRYIAHERKRNQARVTKQKLVEERVSKGLCGTCNTPNLDNIGKKKCLTCMRKNSQINIKKREERKLQGKCTKCGEELTKQEREKRIICDTCAEADSDNKKQVNQQKLAAGKCTHCSGEKELWTQGNYCATCSIKAAAHRWLRDRTRWVELKAKLDEQNQECAISGEKLLVTINANVDHIIPRAKGGQDEMENLHWTSERINKAKNDMTLQEYVDLCCLIADRYRAGLIKTLQPPTV